MPDSNPVQIVASANSAPLQLVTAVQYAVTFLSGLAVANHWLGQDTAAQIIAAVPGACALGVGLYRTWQNNKDKRDIINSPHTSVPEAVAVVK